MNNGLDDELNDTGSKTQRLYYTDSYATTFTATVRALGTRERSAGARA